MSAVLDVSGDELVCSGAGGAVSQCYCCKYLLPCFLRYGLESCEGGEQVAVRYWRSGGNGMIHERWSSEYPGLCSINISG